MASPGEKELASHGRNLRDEASREHEMPGEQNYSSFSLMSPCFPCAISPLLPCSQRSDPWAGSSLSAGLISPLWKSQFLLPKHVDYPLQEPLSQLLGVSFLWQ